MPITYLEFCHRDVTSEPDFILHQVFHFDSIWSFFDLVCTLTDDPILTMFNLYLALMTLLDLHVKRTIWPVLTPMTLHDRSFWSLFTFIWPQWPFMALLTFSDFILTLMTRRSYLDPNSHFLAPLTFSRPTWHFFDLAWPLFILNNLFRSIFDPGDPL